MRLSSVLATAAIAVLLVVLVGPTPGSAAAVECTGATPYPGDAAPKADIAAWMAGGAAARGIPGELPVMAALVESNLVNLKSGPSDSKGYFQMREGIWGAGYPGFPDDPELQLDWFLDRATATRTPPYPGETLWGEWVADVQRPAQQYRYRYQLRLAEARLLIGPTCSPADTVLPVTEVKAPAKQQALAGKGLKVKVSCPAEACTVHVAARVLLGLRPRLVAPPVALAPAQQTKVRIRLTGDVRRLVVRALGRREPVLVRFAVTTTDVAGNTTVTKRKVRVTRPSPS